MKKIFLAIILSCVLACQTKDNSIHRIAITKDWKFKKVSDSIWNKAIVPGNIYSDLLNLKIIPDPFTLNNEEKVQWVSKTDWEYQTNFKLPNEVLNKKNIQLNLNGIDTYADIYLNNQLITQTKNAFVNYQIDIKKIAKASNTLRVVFTHPEKNENQKKTELTYQLPEGNRIFTRKAQFQYGWDWGPKLNTMGIWKPIELIAWNQLRITQINIKQKDISNVNANLSIETKISSSETKKVKFEVLVNGKTTSKNIQLKKGVFLYKIPISIQNPKLWWPHNVGKPNTYTFNLKIKDNQSLLAEKEVKKGIRTVELITDKDDKGKTFYFKINGKPIYVKGANYIPQHSFQEKVTSKHYEKLLSDVVKSNMNMLRVWGGGIYENDLFYELCDEKGIMVWQDFMFACAMYPGNQDFLENVQEEAQQQVSRLQNYASVVLWCGNNESSEGWHRWGWQNNRSEKEKKEIWSHYLKVFDSILPNTVTKYGNKTPYWETSPSFGRGNPKYEFEGDAHDWWIWHDAYPFEHLTQRIPRFMSEFGFQSMPSYEVISYINQNNSLSLKSKAMLTHQKHSRGFQLIDEYMSRDYHKPTNDEDYVYVSQLLQAKGIVMGIEAQRRKKPYNMGTLFWQLNDCWPVISWSSIDYFGNWKALQYKATKAYNNLLISCTQYQDTLKTYIVNDNLHPVKGILKVKQITFDGKTIFEDSSNSTVDTNTSKVVHKYKLKTKNHKNTVIVTEFNNVQSLHYLAKPKELLLQKVDIQQEVKPLKNGFSITLKSNLLAKDVFLYTKTKGHFSDNFFDLLPNQSKTVYFKTNSDKLEAIKLKTLNNIPH